MSVVLSEEQTRSYERYSFPNGNIYLVRKDTLRAAERNPQQETFDAVEAYMILETAPEGIRGERISGQQLTDIVDLILWH